MGIPRGSLFFFVIYALFYNLAGRYASRAGESMHTLLADFGDAASGFNLAHLPIWPAGPQGPGSPSGSKPGKGINP